MTTKYNGLRVYISKCKWTLVGGKVKTGYRAEYGTTTERVFVANCWAKPGELPEKTKKRARDEAYRKMREAKTKGKLMQNHCNRISSKWLSMPLVVKS